MADDMNRLPEEDENNESMEDMEEFECYTLTDEDGNESRFELIGKCTIDDATYYAMTELDDMNNELSEEYVILRVENEDGEEILCSIEDDEEFDRVADYFDDQFANIDYDSDN